MLIDFPMYGVKIEVPEGVYAPAEDSFLLLDTALKEIKAPAKVLETGTGSGLIACALARQGFDVLAVDADGKAVETAGKNAETNKVKIEVRQSDLFESVKGKFDYVVFNPPYVESEGECLQDVASGGGGKAGRPLTNSCAVCLGILPKAALRAEGEHVASSTRSVRRWHPYQPDVTALH